MKKGIKILTTLTFFLGIFFNSCTKESNPILSDSIVEPILLGEWYRIDTLSFTVPGPHIAMNGIQIISDKSINSLGIETSTGRVAISEMSTFKSLIKANDGIIILEYYAPVGLVIDTFNYNVENKKLSLINKSIKSGHMYRNDYYRTELNAQLINPINSYLSVKIDNKSCENSKVYKHPSAYVIKDSISELVLVGVIKDTAVQVIISGFHGIGTYEIPYQKGVLRCKDGNFDFTFISDSVSTGIIIIDEYNENSNVCSGNFSFTAIRYDYYDTQIHKKELTEGIFSVPIYK